MILIRSQSGKTTSISELGPLHNGTPAGDNDIRQLALAKLIFFDSDSNLNLTDKGTELALQVLKKHQILLAFFSEILGLDDGAASNEACKLEHSVDDSGISRLRGIVSEQGILINNSCKSRLNLSECSEGSIIRILSIKEHGNDRLLHDLGFCPGEHIRIIRKLHNSSLIIEVKGCEIAISRDVARDVNVTEEK